VRVIRHRYLPRDNRLLYILGTGQTAATVAILSHSVGGVHSPRRSGDNDGIRLIIEHALERIVEI
jgi:hypothetical protein